MELSDRPLTQAAAQVIVSRGGRRGPSRVVPSPQRRRAQRPRRGRRDFGPWRREQGPRQHDHDRSSHDDPTGNVMHMAMLGMIGTVIGLGGHRAGPVLDLFHGRSNRQRQGHDQTYAKRPDPAQVTEIARILVLWVGPPSLSCLIPPGGIISYIWQKITPTQATPPSPPG